MLNKQCSVDALHYTIQVYQVEHKWGIIGLKKK